MLCLLRQPIPVLTIPAALEDRMEVIELSGYTDFEKHKIATFHPNGLIPKQLKSHGLKEENVTIADSAIFDIIHKYTREAGVRSLERNITSICRKIAKQIVTDDTPDVEVKVTALNLNDYLGPPKHTRTKAQEHDEVGVSTGMVWTQVGGDIVSVEATLMPGEGKLNMTGQLQDVMRESVQTGVAYLRSRAEHFEIPKETFEKQDIHIHIPEGAVPKDGPLRRYNRCNRYSQRNNREKGSERCRNDRRNNTPWTCAPHRWTQRKITCSLSQRHRRYHHARGKSERPRGYSK